MPGAEGGGGDYLLVAKRDLIGVVKCSNTGLGCNGTAIQYNY